MRAFKLRARSRTFMMLGAGVGAMSVAITTPALAQVAAPATTATTATPATADTPENAIIVTGVRASVASALDLKKSADSLVDSIVAEDIGKLPDNNVVEALQHVTGVSILRTGVENSTVLIRGLPDVATQLNGRQIFTSSSRTISLPDLPAELLARVDVKKSPTAEDVEGGIAGIIDVTLHRPLDFKGLQVAASAKGTYGSIVKKWSPQGSILLSDRWDTGIGEIGFLVNAAYVDRSAATNQFVNQGATWRNFRTPAAGQPAIPGVGTGPGAPCATTTACPANTVPSGGVAYPGTITLYQQLTDIKRTTVSSSLQWRPSNTLEVYADYFFASLRSRPGTKVNVILMTTCPSVTGTVAFPGTNIGQVLPSGCFGLTSMQARRSKEDTHQGALGFNWEPTDRLKVKAQGSYTTSRDNTISEIVDAQYNYGPQGVTVNVNPTGDGSYDVVQPGNPQLDPANNYVDQWYDIRNPRSGFEYSGRFDLEYNVSDDSFLRSLVAGYRYNDREATSDAAGTGLNCGSVNGPGAGNITGGSDPYNRYRQLAVNSPACVAYRNGSTPQPYTVQGNITKVGGVSYASLGQDSYATLVGEHFGGQYSTKNWVSLDPDWLFANVEKIRTLYGYSGPQDFILSQHFDVKEKAHAFYGRANYSVDFPNGMTLDGNIGVRVVATTLTEGGFTSKYVPLDTRINPATIGTGPGQTATGRPYAPNESTNATCITCLVYTAKVGSVKDTQVLPSFNARLLLLPGFYARASFSKTVTRPTFAQLNPGETVNAATATLPGTVNSGNPNLSPVKSTNYDADLTYYWGGGNHIGLSMFYRKVNGYIQNQSTIVIIDGLTYTRNRPENLINGEIKGIEAGYSQFLDFLPGVLSGLGFDVNATYIEAPFNNVPKFHANLTGIYEKGPVSFRLSYTYNAPYRIADFVGGVQPQDRWASVRTNMDASLNYTLNRNLSVSLDATNMLNTRQREHAGSGSVNEMLFPTTLSAFDRTYAVGVRYKM